MLTLLKQPYPFTKKTTRHAIIQSCVEGIFVAFVLIVMQPFGISNFELEHKNIYLAMYGLVTCICGLILRLIIFKSFPTYFKESNWTISREITSILLLISLISISNISLTVLLFNGAFTWKNALEMLFMVFVIGIFPIVFGVMLNYIIQLKRHNEIFTVKEKTSDEAKNTLISLIAENQKDKFNIDSSQLLFIESSENYSTIHYLENGLLKKELIRSSLSRLEIQLTSDKIVRVHRSYIANLALITSVTGNAQGYKLHFENTGLYVPLARKYSSVLKILK